MTTFHFLVALSKRKNKSMGNYISKINKDYFFAFEEEIKNDTSSFKGKAKSNLEKAIRGKTYTGFHSIKKFSNIITLAKLQTGVWWRNLFKTGLGGHLATKVIMFNKFFLVILMPSTQ